LDEVNEARRVVNRTAELIREDGNVVHVFHDDVSRTQDENLDRIVDWHNSISSDFALSVHFNAYQPTTTQPRGVEVLYVTQEELARSIASEIAGAASLINRGPKYRNDLYFLNQTREKAVLIETAFCDSKPDCDLYREHFEGICQVIALSFASGERPPPPADALLHVTGKCSWFGGPTDTGVSASEGLAFLYNVGDAPHLFLPAQPEGTTGLARRPDPRVPYLACRWDYATTPKEMLRDKTRKALVRASGKEFICYPADWGPHENTARVADLSPGLLIALGLETDDEVEIISPA